VQLPIDSEQECNLVLIDLLSVQPRNLTPCASRVVAVLKIFGGQDERREKHASSTLESTIREAIIWLLHGEVMLGDMGLNKNQVIQSYLESRVAGAGATKRLLDKGSQREDSLAAELTAADHGGQGPDGLNNVGSRI
jgi:hypothetical protein